MLEGDSIDFDAQRVYKLPYCCARVQLLESPLFPIQ